MAHSFAGTDTAAIARRILGSWARRYIGVAVGVGAFLVFVIIAPSRSPISAPFTLPSVAGANTPPAPAAISPETANTTQAAVPTVGIDAAGAAPGSDLTGSTLPPAPRFTGSGPAPQPEPAPAPPDSPPETQPGPSAPSPPPCQPLIPPVLGLPAVCGP